jgi:SAM-dependent methyltransferase
VIEQKPTNTGYAAPRQRESSIAALPDFDHAGQQNGDGSVGILPVTGERLVPGALADRLFREHEARYVFAGKFVAGKRTLDVACGSGMGTKYLSVSGAASSVGLDIDPTVVSFASKRYADCKFAQCDVTKLCIADASIDIVVSFETIEHIKDQAKFLNECYRVLKPGGVLICSTPNQMLSKWAPQNPFHVHELTVSEFTGTVTSIFGDVQLFSQNCVNYLIWLPRYLATGAMEQLGLTAPIRKLLRKSPTGSGRVRTGTEYRASDSDVAGIVPYRASLLTQPTFFIAVARKR